MMRFIALFCGCLFLSSAAIAQCDATFEFYGSANDPATFYFLSPADSNNVVADHFWEFGDGVESMIANPTHTYPQDGVFTACLTLSAQGCTDTQCATLVIQGSNNDDCYIEAFADVSPDSTVLYTNGSPDISYWMWVVDGVTLGSEPYLQLPDLEPDTYTACVTAGNDTDCIDESCVTFVIQETNNSCDVEIEYDWGEGWLYYSLSNLNLEGWFIWSVNGEEIFDGIQGSFEVEIGLYDLCVVYESTDGCTDIECIEIVIDDPNNGQDSICYVQAFAEVAGNSVFLTSDYQLINAQEAYWEHVGTNNISYDYSPVIENLAPGEHTFCLTVTYFNVNCTVSDCVTVVIDSITSDCNFNIDYYSENGQDFVFEAIIDNDATIFTSWYFSDTAIVIADNPAQYTWFEPGVYEVCASAINGDQVCVECVEILVQESQDSLACAIAFDYTVADNGDFIFQAYLANDNPTNNIPTWSFGDGISASGWEVSHTFESGTYDICVHFSNANQNCENTFCETITVVGGNLTFDIYGELTTGNSALDQQVIGTVYLIEFQEDLGYLALADSFWVDSIYFNFQDLDPAKTYYLKSKMDDSSPLYAAFLPTYFEELLSWMDATAVQATDQGIVLKMVAGANPGGPGFIEGYIVEGAGKTDGGLENVEVVLTDMNDLPVAYTYSDENGYFLFEEVGYGSYWVFTEILNQEPDPVMVTIEGEEDSDNYVEFTVDEFEGISGSVGTAIDELGHRNVLSVHPNPFDDVLNVEVPFTDKEMEVVIMNSIGQSVYSGTEFSNFLQIDLSEIAKGIYYLQVSNRAGETLVHKIIKN